MAKKIITVIPPECVFVFYNKSEDAYYRTTSVRHFAEFTGKTLDMIKNLVHHKAKHSGDWIFLGKGIEDTVNKKVLFN